MVPDDFGAALELGANRQDTLYDLLRYSDWARMWPRGKRWNEPRAGREPKGRDDTWIASWSVVVFQLDPFVEGGPFALPAPNSAAVDSAAVGDGLGRYLFTNEQLHGKSSRFWQVRIGRIGHSRLLSVRCSDLYSLGRLPFLVQGMLQRW